MYLIKSYIMQNRDTLDYSLLNKEFTLAESARLSDMKHNRIIIPRGRKVKIVSVFWMRGYKLQDEYGNECWVWEIKER